MRFVSFSEVAERFKGKRVAVVGSAPSCAEGTPGFIDSHDVVVRVQNYKTGEGQGFRCDVHYAFYGTSVTKTAEELKADGVKLCMCKLPNSKPIHSEWHEKKNKPHGVDYRYIYKARASWWFCDTFVPDDERFLTKFRMLGNHQPTTGFAAILDVLECEPRAVTLTGFDFFTSGIHNVDEQHRKGDPDDPICHRPDLEARALVELARRHPIWPDKKLAGILADTRLEKFRRVA